MRRELCICASIETCRQSLETRTRIVILMHHRELVRTTNTARLAQLALKDCEIRVRGRKDSPLNPEGVIDPARQALFLYPTEDAQELTPSMIAAFDRPVTLIVPDGTWAQASKVAKREPFLLGVPRVKLTPTQSSQYGLRRNPKANGLATFEAIAQALGLLEGPKVREQLERLFGVMVNRTLWSRGVH